MGIALLPRRYTSWKPPLGAQIDRGHLLAQGLVTCLPFNEAAGGLWRDVGTQTTATLIGSPVVVSSPYGPSLSIGPSGAIDGLQFADSDRYDVGQLTSFFALIYPRTLAPTPVGVEPHGINMLWSDEDINTSTAIWRLGDEGLTPGQPNLSFRDGGGTEHKAHANTAIATLTWSAVGMTTDGTNATFYLNGRQDGQTAFSQTPAQQSAEDWRVGTSRTGLGSERPFDGQIAVLLRYARALSAAEMQWLAVEPFALFAPPRLRAAYVRRRFFLIPG